MKTLFYALVMLFCTLRMEAATFAVDGDLSWEITEPRCTFNLVGDLQNTSAYGSGTIKLVLWASKAPYPSAASLISEYTLGQLGVGQQFSDFSLKTTSNIPAITGTYYFTIAVVEYTTAGWVNRLLIGTGTKNLVTGNFADQVKWKIPTAKVIAPPAALNFTNLIKLTLKATNELNLFPVDSQELTKIDIFTKTKINLTDDSGKSSASFTYLKKQGTLNGKKVPTGILTYTGSSSSATITLYFQSTTSGTYKSVKKVSSITETTWGTFTFQ